MCWYFRIKISQTDYETLDQVWQCNILHVYKKKHRIIEVHNNADATVKNSPSIMEIVVWLLDFLVHNMLGIVKQAV